MDIKKLDRTTLKLYFVKNAVPTESNFADLIDGLINQKDDGIAKLAGEPLSVQADGNDTSQKKAINFYKSFGDPKAAWTLSLNPRVDPSNANTAKPGWSIGDADGNSKLFIDETTGNLGIGTVEPGGYKLNVKGSALFTGNYLYVNSESAGRLRVGAAWGMPGLFSSDDGAKPLMLGVPAGQKVYLGENNTDAFVEGGTGNSYFKGNVGIGTNGPAGKLEVNGTAVISNGNSYATRTNYMAPGSLTVGGVNASYGGGTSWNTNTAGLLLETLTNTEIAVHDSNTRLASLMYYEGDAANRITIGRDMGWGNIGQVVVNAGQMVVAGSVFAGSSDIYFTKADHTHTGWGNTEGHAAIENAASPYNCLMILGRWVGAATGGTRRVQLYDFLQVNGTFVNNSDARAKRDVVDLEYGLKEITQLRPVSFNWKDIANPHKSIGLIAQEVMPIISEAVYRDGDEQDAGLSIAYTSLIPALINAVKELATKVEQLSGRAA